VARHAEAFERVTQAILETPGDLDPALRKAAEAFAASLVAGDGDATGLPRELAPYVEKVARHAYRVVDADVEGLRRAGYSEDAIFELTLATALGAARARLDRGLAALRAEP
jgi:alkylhydroperoxidase family enzyme